MKRFLVISTCIFLLFACTLKNENDTSHLNDLENDNEISEIETTIEDKIEDIIRNDDQLVHYLNQSRADRVEVKNLVNRIEITLGRPDHYSYSPTIVVYKTNDEVKYSYEFFKSVDFKYEKNGELLDAELYGYVKGDNNNLNRQPRHMRLKTPYGYFEFTIVDDKFYYDPEQNREIQPANISELKEMYFLDDLTDKLLDIYHDFTDNLFTNKNHTIEAITDVINEYYE